MNCRNYYIDDLTNDKDKLKIIFVLESPYSDEVIHNHPVAGASGLSMSRLLNIIFPIVSSDIPLGCQIFRKKITNVGVLNCSKFPLDKNVYDCSTVFKEFPLDEFEIIRKNPKSKKRNNFKLQKIHNILLKNFKKRVELIIHNNFSCIFVPCGELARNFIGECQLDNNRKYNKKIPHPSRNQWSTEGKFEDYYHFLDILDSKLNNS